MKNKYYTPSIEEFHVGFEYEMKETFGDGTVKTREQFDKAEWLKCNMLDLNELPYIERTMRGNNSKRLPLAIRVKYLDRDDIESLGFEYDNELKFPNGKHTSKVVEFYNGECGLSRIDDGMILITKYKDGLFDKLFEGNIKNKSELKVLLKQLGIYVTDKTSKESGEDTR